MAVSRSWLWWKYQSVSTSKENRYLVPHSVFIYLLFLLLFLLFFYFAFFRFMLFWSLSLLSSISPSLRPIFPLPHHPCLVTVSSGAWVSHRETLFTCLTSREICCWRHKDGARCLMPSRLQWQWEVLLAIYTDEESCMRLLRQTDSRRTQDELLWGLPPIWHSTDWNHLSGYFSPPVQGFEE